MFSYGALLIFAVQFLAASCWTVYAVFLPQLASSVGIAPTLVPWILTSDQLIFAVCDVALGFRADLIRSRFKSIGPFIAGLTALSCLIFLALPWVMTLKSLDSRFSSALFLGFIGLWALTSSVLRAPTLAFLYECAPAPQATRWAMISLFGLGLAGACSPYFGSILANQDPRLPFALSSVTLMIMVFGLVRFKKSAVSPPQSSGSNFVSRKKTLYFLTFLLLVSFGVQLHSSLNSTPFFLRFSSKDNLGYLLPVFWIGFNLTIFAINPIAKAKGIFKTILASTAIGIIGLAGSYLAPTLPLLIVFQLIAGAGWAGVFSAGIALAAKSGFSGKEGRHIGLFFCMLSSAACLRILLVANSIPQMPSFSSVIRPGPIALWVLGFLLLWIGLAKDRNVREMDRTKMARPS